MPGFIKFDVDMHGKSEVDSICEAVELDEDAVVGKLLRVWVWVDRMGDIEDRLDGDGVAEGTLRTIDRQARHPGFGEAMAAVNWVIVDGSVLRFPRLGKYGSDTARRRFVDADRKRREKRESEKLRSGLRETPDRAPAGSGAASESARTKEKEKEKGNDLPEELTGDGEKTTPPIPQGRWQQMLHFDRPAELRTPACDAAWAKWIQFRIEAERRPLPIMSCREKFTKWIGEGGESAMVAALEQAIREGFDSTPTPRGTVAGKNGPASRFGHHHEETNAGVKSL